MLFLTPGEQIFLLGRALLGVMKSDELTFLEQVSGWTEEVVSSVSFYGKEVSSNSRRGGERILGSTSFSLCKASRRMGEECTLWSEKIFKLMKTS